MDNRIVNAQHQQTHPGHYGNGFSQQNQQQQRTQLNHSYDPNMCTTAARFSESFYQSKVTTGAAMHSTLQPPQPSDVSSHHPEEELLGFNNVILLQETAHEIGAEAVVNNSETIEEVPQSTLTLPALQTQLHIQEGTFVTNYQYMHYEQTASINHEAVNSAHVAGMLVHRSPNGHLYQQNYLANTEHASAKNTVEYVQMHTEHVAGNVMFTAERAVEMPDNVSEGNHLTSFELSHQYDDDYQHAADVVDENSAELIAQYAADLANVPAPSDDNYVGVDVRSLTATNKDEQRLLLESTMSPLLAAVNDITKRDAELQLYLSQNLEKDTTQYLAKDIQCTGKAPTQNESTHDSSDEDDYLLVSDKTVECRAKASLPSNYLLFGEVDDETNEPSVFAKKPIPRRTMFGPYEGEVVYVSDIDLDVIHVQTPRQSPVLMIDESHILDVTNEDTSNWMRYIRLAQSYAQQNIHLLHEDGKLFLRCVRDIRSNEELRVGYHSSYAERFLLPLLQPTAEDLKDDFYRKHPWKCFECKLRFSSSSEMKLHLNEHDEHIDSIPLDKEQKPSRELGRSKWKIRSIRISADCRRCQLCDKVFMTNEMLKLHVAKQHKQQKQARVNFLNCKSSTKKGSKNVNSKDSKFMYKCNLCAKRFHKETLLMQHKFIHEGKSPKPHQCHICQQRCATPAALAAHLQGHEAIQYSCVFCAQKFKYVRHFKKHVGEHRTSDNGFFACPHCKKQYADYHLVRKHVRIFHTNREFFCTNCGKKFYNTYALQRHKQIHMENKNYACSACGKQFGRKDHLLTHTKRKHSSDNAQTSNSKDEKRAEVKSSSNDAMNNGESPKSSIAQEPKSLEESIGSTLINDGTQYLKMSPTKQLTSATTSITATSSSSNRRKQTPTKLKALELNADTVTFVALSEMLSPFIISESALNVNYKLNKENDDVNKAATNKIQSNDNNIKKASDTFSESVKHTIDSNAVKSDCTGINSSFSSPLYPFTCHICPHVSFKRRGMLVNHIAKVHPNENIEQLESLKAPIVKQLLIFPCPYCSNVYKLNAKRKAHIIKHHPGCELPASMRKTRAQGVEVAQSAVVANATSIVHSAEVAATVGTLEVSVHKCDRCYKQYGARSRLVSHYRKAHPEQADLPPQCNTTDDLNTNFPMLPISNSELMQQQSVALEPEINITPYQLQSPVSPENKLLKLSSAAALELSRFDDDFFNERIRCTTDEEEVVVPTVFSDPTTHNDLQHLPALFEESSIVGIDTNSMEKYNRSSIESQFFEKINKFS